MENTITIDGYTFDYDSQNKMYECKGAICFDDEHDEVPEEGLWKAAQVLMNRLINQGMDAEVEHSEKGWVEVNLIL